MDRIPDASAAEALAGDLFEQGFTCGQAVLGAHAARLGLERDAAFRARARSAAAWPAPAGPAAR